MAGATGETNTAIACAPLQTAAESFEHAAATREATAPPATATSRSAHSGGGLPWHSSETAASATPSAAPSAASLTITDVSQLSALKADVPAPPATALPSGSPASAAARSTPLGMGADGRSSRTASPTPLSCTHARISSPAGRESSAGLSCIARVSACFHFVHACVPKNSPVSGTRSDRASVSSFAWSQLAGCARSQYWMYLSMTSRRLGPVSCPRSSPARAKMYGSALARRPSITPCTPAAMSSRACSSDVTPPLSVKRRCG
mmetsp:Transcript_7520/g.19745  ORF Transcript_7520/g.19745 Transcript_7520/m.19745 type:complete len:262 (-) Transcript_7520:187-972(-)